MWVANLDRNRALCSTTTSGWGASPTSTKVPLDTKPLTSKPSTPGTRLRIFHLLRLTLCLHGNYTNALDFCRFRRPPPKTQIADFAACRKIFFWPYCTYTTIRTNVPPGTPMGTRPTLPDLIFRKVSRAYDPAANPPKRARVSRRYL